MERDRERGEWFRDSEQLRRIAAGEEEVALAWDEWPPKLDLPNPAPDPEQVPIQPIKRPMFEALEGFYFAGWSVKQMAQYLACSPQKVMDKYVKPMARAGYFQEHRRSRYS